ncbi:sensor histidine kinase, partial [Streptomyces sp. SID3343]|uniref:sensor histidine kinase n=1 Tax=Streptomyces sp. SID3343 TaxID=2690260 RepID=UPI001367DA42
MRAPRADEPIPTHQEPQPAAGEPARPDRRGLSIRTLLILLTVVPSLALVTLWGFTSYRLVDHARNVDNETRIAQNAGTPGYDVMVALQIERRLTAAWLAAPSPQATSALGAQRAKTDASVVQFTKFTDSTVRETPGNAVRRSHEILTGLAKLTDQRRTIDSGISPDRDRLLGFYSTRIADQISLFQALSQSSDSDYTFAGQSLVAQFRAGEALSREDAVITYAQASGKLSAADFADFTQNVGVRRHTYDDQIDPSLPADLRPMYLTLTSSPAWLDLVSMEFAVVAAADTPAQSMPRGRVTAQGTPVPGELVDWRSTLDRLVGEIAAFDSARTDQVLAIGEKTTDDTWNQVYLLSALGFVFVLAGGLLCWRVTRSVRERLVRLRDATVELGTRRLPDAVERLQRGEHVDVATEAPDLPTGRDEIGQVAAAFNTAQRAALDGAVQLARQREGFAKVFVNTALRTQSLVNRQIGELDAMERRHQDPELLRELFTIDHLATRLRRYEENLVVLTGNRPGRRWSRPVPLIDVVRSAVGEVEDYHRVDVYADTDLELNGPSVGGLIHLLSELIENAAMFSPPDTPVHVRAVSVAKGLAVEIEDRGLGLPDDEIESLNRQLATPVAFDVIALAEDVRLGLFVVAQLAERLGVSVTLRSSPYGGTLAIVFLPEDLITRGSTGPKEPVEQTGPFRLARAGESESAGRQHPEPLALPSAARPALEPVPAEVSAPSESTSVESKSTAANPSDAKPADARQTGANPTGANPTGAHAT